MKLNKELEEVLDNIPQISDFTSGGEPIYSKKYVIHAMKEYAKSKYVEKQKLEFAIEQLKRFRESTFGKGVDIIKELEQKLTTL